MWCFVTTLCSKPSKTSWSLWARLLSVTHSQSPKLSSWYQWASFHWSIETQTHPWTLMHSSVTHQSSPKSWSSKPSLSSPKSYSAREVCRYMKNCNTSRPKVKSPFLRTTFWPNWTKTCFQCLSSHLVSFQARSQLLEDPSRLTLNKTCNSSSSQTSSPKLTASLISIVAIWMGPWLLMKCLGSASHTRRQMRFNQVRSTGMKSSLSSSLSVSSSQSDLKKMRCLERHLKRLHRWNSKDLTMSTSKCFQLF